MTARIVFAPIRGDIQWGGRYQVTGTVAGVSGPRRVLLLWRRTGQVVRKTWSDDAGTYAFRYIAGSPIEYIALAIDHENLWNCAVADRALITAV